MTSANQHRVSLLSRILAWIFLALAAVGLPALIAQLLDGRWSLGLPQTVFGLLGILVTVPLFTYVAIKGRAPAWWSSTVEGRVRDIMGPGRSDRGS